MVLKRNRNAYTFFVQEQWAEINKTRTTKMTKSLFGSISKQIAVRWNSLDDKSVYIHKEENDRRRYFLEKTTDSLNSIFKTASAPSDTSEDRSSDNELSSKSDDSQQLVHLENLSEIDIPRTPRNTAMLPSMPLMAEDSLDDVVSDEESTICDEKPNLSDYTIPTSIDTEAIFSTLSDFSKLSVGKIKESLTSLRKRHSPTTSSTTSPTISSTFSPTSGSTSVLDCRNFDSSNDDQDRMKYFIFMFTISLFFWGQFFEHITKKIKNTRFASKQKSE